MYSAKAIGNFFVAKGLDSISTVRLLKMVYLSHAWHLALYAEPLLDEVIVAGPYGPDVRTLKEQYLARRGNGPLSTYLMEMGANKEIYTPHVPLSDTKTITLLNQVWDAYNKFTDIQLSNMLREEGSPWDEIFEEGILVGTVIPNFLIETYYRSLAFKYAERGEI